MKEEKLLRNAKVNSYLWHFPSFDLTYACNDEVAKFNLGGLSISRMRVSDDGK